MGPDPDMSNNLALRGSSNADLAERGRRTERFSRGLTAESCHLQAGGPKEEE
jgi:hypothetical protein